MFADSSNYINQKKIEINRKQERARILMDEFVREAEATCQGKNKDILRDPGLRSNWVGKTELIQVRYLLQTFTHQNPVVLTKVTLEFPRMG